MSKISNQNTYPLANPADGSYIIGTDVTDLNTTKTYLFSGVSTYINEKLTDSSMTPVYASEKILQEVRFAEAVSKGDPVYVSGYNAGQNRPEVQKADASDAAQMPSIGLAAADYAINTNGYVISVGDLSDVNTDTLGVEGDVLYVASGGGLTVTKPTGSNLIQNVGKISRSNQTNGSIEVFSVGRTNDVPNLSEGKIFVGSAANTIESTVVHLDETNDRLGINQTSPTSDLHVGGTAAVDTTLSVGGVLTLNSSNVTQTNSRLDFFVGANADSMLQLNANSGDWDFRIGEETSFTTITGDSGSGIDITSVGVVMASFNGNTPTNSFIKLGGSGAANTLDDYEEGTFTPTVGSYTGGSLSPVYNVQDGKYTKIGNVCIAKVRIVLDETSTFSGNGVLVFGGLPFPIDGAIDTSSVSCSVSKIIRVDGFNRFVGAIYGTANTTVSLQRIDNPEDYDQTVGVTTANLETGGDITIDFTLTYRTT